MNFEEEIIYKAFRFPAIYIGFCCSFASHVPVGINGGLRLIGYECVLNYLSFASGGIKFG